MFEKLICKVVGHRRGIVLRGGQPMCQQCLRCGKIFRLSETFRKIHDELQMIAEDYYDHNWEERKMRVLEIGTQRYTQVVCNDEPGAGGACHSYHVVTVPSAECEADRVANVRFQNGPIKESGVNGCFNEDLIAIVIDRLRGFQSGQYSCRENALALTKLEEALHWLNHRTAERQRRGVEGTNVV